MKPNRIFAIVLLMVFIVFVMIHLIPFYWTSYITPSAVTQSLYIGTGVILLLMMIDALRARKSTKNVFHITRKVQQSVSIDHWYPVELTIENISKRTHSARIFDHYPIHSEVDLFTHKIRLVPNEWITLHYQFQPYRRGKKAFECTEVWLQSPWKMWDIKQKISNASTIHIYPDFGRLGKDALQATFSQNITGTLKRKKLGQGMDFAELKEYQQGDLLRQIDWAASSRHQKLISRHYQEEKDQRVMIWMDCGRRMGAVEFEDNQRYSHFDRSLNAALILSYIALHHGDAVGLMTFGATHHHNYVRPTRGKTNLAHLLNACYEIEPSLDISDYESAAQRLMQHETKRSLVLLFTNLRDEDDESILKAAHMIRKKHLLVIINLRELSLDQLLHADQIENTNDAALYLLSYDFQLRRERVIQKLKNSNVMVVDIEPKNVTNAVINQYIAIKAAGKL